MERLYQKLSSLDFGSSHDALARLIQQKRELFLLNPKGNALKYKRHFDQLPDVIPSVTDVAGNVISIGSPGDITDPDTGILHQALQALCPWRKGPFDFFGIGIDSEWRSWIKWDRLKGHISPATNRTILDIGSSNGYYMFRMSQAKPRMVLGLEPQHTFYFQYLFAQKYLNSENLFCIPATFDELPVIPGFFDQVFAMGILSHRKSPLAMLKKIRSLVHAGAELVVENLVIDSMEDVCLFPETRYAKMRNIFFIPSVKVLETWLKRTGFGAVVCVDITKTGTQEQRRTDWIQTESLADFLAPDNPGLTVEGYPAPVRAIMTAKAV